MHALMLHSLSDSPLVSSAATVQTLSECDSIRGVSQVVPGRARSPDAILVRRFFPLALVCRCKLRRVTARVTGCLMLAFALRCMSTRAEDTALLKSNRSAASGAKTEERAAGFHVAARPSSLLRDWPECDKLSRHDAATVLAGCPSPLASADRTKFHFTVNQDRGTSRHKPSLMK